MTFSEVQKELKYITNRILSRELSLLQEDGLVLSKDGRYRCTQSGLDLIRASDKLVDWTERYKCVKRCPSEQKCSLCATYPAVIGANRHS